MNKNKTLEILQKVYMGKLTPIEAEQRLSMIPSLGDWVKRNKINASNFMGDTDSKYYTTDKMDWNEENYWFGVFKSLRIIENEFL